MPRSEPSFGLARRHELTRRHVGEGSSRYRSLLFMVRSVEQAERWHDVCYATLRSLSKQAEGCLLAAESHDLSVEARQIAFGVGRKPTHRAVFTI
jgi:hypothetical protein